jgi:hypothetical protein
MAIGFVEGSLRQRNDWLELENSRTGAEEGECVLTWAPGPLIHRDNFLFVKNMGGPWHTFASKKLRQWYPQRQIIIASRMSGLSTGLDCKRILLIDTPLISAGGSQ